MIGGLIMAHGDDQGLRLPPRIAPPVQVVVIAVKDDDPTVTAASTLADSLAAAGIRARLDARTDQGFGRRTTEWELKGVPLRLEIGPRDLERGGECTLVRRDTKQKFSVGAESVVATIRELLDAIHTEMFTAARDRLGRRTTDATTSAGALDASATGFVRIPWNVLGEHGERQLNARGATVRCLQASDGGLPDVETPSEELMAIVGRSY